MRNVALLASGGLIAQVITLASMPVITRLFDPESLGTLGIFLSLISVTAQVAALSYPIAITLPKRDTDALGLIKLSLIIAVLTSLCTLAIITLFHNKIATLLNLQNAASYLFIIPLAMFASALLAAAEQWTTRKQLFKAKALTLSLHAATINSAKIIIGILNPVAIGLIIVTTIGFFTQSAMLTFAATHRTTQKQFAPAPLTPLAKKYADFPRYRAPEQLLNALAASLPILMLTSLFDVTTAGFFALALSALSAPTMLVGKAVTDALTPNLVSAFHAKRNLSPLIRRPTLILLVLSIPPCLLMAFVGPEIFALIFGETWQSAGEYARWIMLWTAAGLAIHPSVAALPIFRAQRTLLIHTVISIVVRATALWLGYAISGEPIMAIASFCLASVAINIILIAITLIYSHQNDAQIR